MSIAARLARPEILALKPYAHAEWRPALERLHANENPWRYDGDASRAGLNRYPEPYPYALEARLAELYGVAPEWLIAGRGSDEGIDLLLRAFCTAARDAVLICPPTFGMYAVAAGVQGAAVIEVPLAREAGWALDLAAVEGALTPAVKLVFLCSPGNPTGAPLAPAAIESLARRLANQALIVVDEAYAEFGAEPSLIAAQPALPNLVVLRTLSKAWALAGARCGALIAEPAIVALLRRVLPPYALPTPSQEAVELALAASNRAPARARIAALIAERERLSAALAVLPAVRQVWPSAANFILLECHDAPRLLAAAERAGLMVRDLSAGSLTRDCLRVTVGTRDQGERLLAAWAAP